MEHKIKTLFNNEYHSVRAPSSLKKGVFDSIKYFDLVKALLEVFIVSPKEIIKALDRNNSKGN